MHHQVSGTTAMFTSTRGGIYVARRTDGDGGTGVAVAVVVVIVVVLLAVGTLLYCRRRGADGRGTARRVMNDIANNFKDEL